MVWKHRGTWFYEVYDSTGKVVLADNTNDWRKMFDAAFFDVGAVRRIERAGHKLARSYPQLVDGVKL